MPQAAIAQAARYLRSAPDLLSSCSGGARFLFSRSPLSSINFGGLPTASICWRRGTSCRGVTSRGEQVQQRADPKAFLGAVAEQAVGVDGVPVAASVTAPSQVTRGFQVGHDG